MNTLHQNMTPRLKPLPARKAATLSVLDIGTSKIVMHCCAVMQPPGRGREPEYGAGHTVRVDRDRHHRSRRGGSRAGW